MLSAKRIVVIGGGFAGCAAAAALRTHGLAVHILDEQATLGGRARSDVLDGLTIDIGAQLFASSYARTLRLLTPDSGFDDRSWRSPSAWPPGLRPSPGRDALVRNGAQLPVQFGSLRSLLAFSAITPREKLGLGRSLLPLLARHRRALDASGERVPESLDGQSARAFVGSYISENAVSVLAEPPLNGAYAMRADEVSLAFFLTLGHYISEGATLAAIPGISTLLATSLRGARHVPAIRVSALARSEHEIHVRAADGATWAADGVVIATDPHTAAQLVAPLCPSDAPLVHWLAGRELRRSWTVAFSVDRALPHDVFGIFEDATHAQLVSACAVHGAKFGADAPRGRDAVLAWPTPRAVEQLASEPAAGIVEAMRPEVERMVPAIAGRIARARVYRFDRGTVVPRPGFVKDHARGRELANALPLPITLAGDYLATPIIEGAVASGLRAADALMSRLT